MKRRIEQLCEHNVRGFKSGVHALDDYLRRHAKGNATQGLGVTWLVLRGDEDPSDWPEIIGFFTVSMAEFPAEVARRLTGEKLPQYPMPVALIGRLARDQRTRGGGMGDVLIAEACKIILEASALVACFGIIVDAKDESALRFYEKYGFVATRIDGDYPRRCFLPIKTIREALGGP